MGLPSSGKSCYLGVAVGFMCRYKLYDIVNMNRDLSRLSETIEDDMKAGKWVGKTTGLTEYRFTKRGSLFDTEYILHDWNGEYFRLLGLDEEHASVEWNKAQEKINGQIVKEDDLRKLYEADCREADAILLFIDGKTLIEKADDGESEKKRTRESLYTLVEILRKSKKRRVISIALTKSDYLENYGEFLDANRKINAKKVEDCLRSNYNATFSEIASAGHKVHVSLVSCIPVREHRSSLSGRGAVPNEGWSFDVLKESNVNMSGVDMPDDVRKMIKMIISMPFSGFLFSSLLAGENMPNDMLAPIRWVIENV